MQYTHPTLKPGQKKQAPLSFGNQGPADVLNLLQFLQGRKAAQAVGDKYAPGVMQKPERPMLGETEDNYSIPKEKLLWILQGMKPPAVPTGTKKPVAAGPVGLKSLLGRE